MKHTHDMAARANSHSVAVQSAQTISTRGTRRRIAPAVIALTGLLCAGAVHAGTFVNVKFQGQNSHATSTSGMGIRLYDGLNSSGSANSPAITNPPLSEGGAFDFKVNNPSSTQFIVPGGGPSATPATLIQELWGQHINSVLNRPAGLTTSQAAGAFQHAVWKLEYDGKAPSGTPGSVNFGKGYVEATSTNAGGANVINTASNWINNSSLNPSPGELANHGAVGGADYQHQGPPVNQIVTPEPSSNLIWLVVAAIGVYPIMRRRSSAA